MAPTSSTTNQPANVVCVYSSSFFLLRIQTTGRLCFRSRWREKKKILLYRRHATILRPIAMLYRSSPSLHGCWITYSVLLCLPHSGTSLS